MVPVFTESIARLTGQHLIAVQTVLRDDYSEYEKARPWMESAADLVIDSTHVPVAEVAERIAVSAEQRMAATLSLRLRAAAERACRDCVPLGARVRG